VIPTFSSHVEDRGNAWRIIINTKPKRTLKNIKKSILKTQKEAERYADRLAEEIEKGLYQESSNMSVSAYFDKWLQHIESTNAWEYKTYVRNKGIIDNYFLPALGIIKISQLKPLEIQEHLDRTQQTENDGPGLKASTALKHYNLLHAAFKQAFKWELIPGNPVDKVSPPTVKEKYDVPILPNGKAIVEFQESFEPGTTLYLPVLISTTGSLRRGEVCGLQWRDMEWETRRLWVRRSLQRITGEGLKLKPYTKNDKIRSVVLPPTVVEILKKEYMARFNGDDLGLHGEEYICLNTKGCPVAPDLITLTFKRKKLPITFHGCRHSHDSLLARLGVRNKLIADRAGRGEVLTEKIYTHLQPDQQDEVSLIVEKDLYKTKKKIRMKLVRKK
jgi:integrase